ncbi:MAG: hypothetical protein WDZ64_00500 [Parcubacteria group bacterium]
MSDPFLTEYVREEMRRKGLSWPLAFKPVIYYNEELEVAEALIADTSYTEVQLAKKHYLAVFERNHHSRYGEEHFVGFNLWVVRGVCAQMGVEPVGNVSMRQILKFLHEHEEDQFIKDAIKEIMLPMLEAHNLDQFEI